MIRTIVRLSRRAGSEPLLVPWPEDWQMTRPDRLPKQRVLPDVARRSRVGMVNPPPILADAGGKRLFLDVVRVNSAGHRAVAVALRDVLVEHPRAGHGTGGETPGL